MHLTPFKAKIFQPGKGIGFYLSSSRLHFGSLLLMLAFALLLKAIDYNSHQTFTPVFLILGIGVLCGSIWGTYSFEKKHGQFGGRLIIEKDHIDIKGNVYNWNAIDKIAFNLGTIHGYDLEPGYYQRFRGGPRYSAGLDNFIEFEHNSKTIKVQFQLKSLLQKQTLEKIIRYQFYLDRISLEKTYNGLHLSYEEIQQLKKDKANYVKSLT